MEHWVFEQQLKRRINRFIEEKSEDFTPQSAHKRLLELQKRILDHRHETLQKQR